MLLHVITCNYTLLRPFRELSFFSQHVIKSGCCLDVTMCSQCKWSAAKKCFYILNLDEFWMFCLNSPQKLTKRIIWISQPCLTYKLLSNDNDHVVQQLEKRLLLPHRRPKTHPEPAEVSSPLLCEGGKLSLFAPTLWEGMQPKPQILFSSLVFPSFCC